MVELEVVNHSLPPVLAHLLVVVPILEEDPFEAGDALSF